MFRSIFAVLAGYVAMSLAVMAGSAVLSAVFHDNSRTAETRDVPTLSMILELIWALPSAILGGFVTAHLARRARAAHAVALAGLVLVLAIGFALIDMGDPIPIWFRVLLPVVAVAGVLVGSRLVSPKPSTAR